MFEKDPCTIFGIMIGTALNSVIPSLVNDTLTTSIASLTSGIDFSKMYWILRK